MKRSRMLSQHQRAHVSKVIRDAHLVLMVEMLGPDAVDRADYGRLMAEGKIKHGISDVVDYVHSVGIAAAQDHAGSDDYHAIVEAERGSFTLLRDRLANRINELGSKLDITISNILLGVDDDVMRGMSGSPIDAAVSKIKLIATDLKRDWFRVVHTESHNAIEEVKSIVFAQHERRVFKKTRPDSCAFCKLLYLKPDGVTPRVFHVRDLMANGTNVGRKARRPTRSGRSRTQWKAVVGATHPFCGCTLTVVPEDAGFDQSGNLVHVGMQKSALIEIEQLDQELVTHRCEE